MANKIQWTPVEEMNLDNGQHTCYSSRDRNDNFIWLTQLSDDTWDVELGARAEPNCFITIANCKTLTSAKRYAARYLI